MSDAVDATRPQQRAAMRNVRRATASDGFRFTSGQAAASCRQLTKMVAGTSSTERRTGFIREFNGARFDGEKYVMPSGGTIALAALTSAAGMAGLSDIADTAMRKSDLKASCLALGIKLDGTETTEDLERKYRSAAAGKTTKFYGGAYGGIMVDLKADLADVFYNLAKVARDGGDAMRALRGVIESPEQRSKRQARNRRKAAKRKAKR